MSLLLAQGYSHLILIRYTHAQKPIDVRLYLSDGNRPHTRHHSALYGITKHHSASQCITRHHNAFQDITVHHSSVQHSTRHQECPKRLHGCPSGGLRSHVPSVVSRQLTSHMHPTPYKALQRISGHYKVSQRITMHHKTPQPTNPGRNVTKSQKYRGREILQIFLKKTK